MAPDQVIRGGLILDPLSERPRPGDIVVRAGVVRDILAPDGFGPDDAVTVDARDRLLLPGLVNAHTHGHGALGRGAVTDRAMLETFLCASAGINGARTVGDIYLSTALSAIEMIRKGCTACYDLSAELPAPSVAGIHAAARAYHDCGMRAVVAPMVSDRTIYQALPEIGDALPAELRAQAAAIAAAPGEAGLRVVEAAIRSWPFDRAAVRPAIGPTIPLHCSDAFLSACSRLAKDLQVGLHTHLAESATQAAVGRKRYGCSLTVHLARLGLLGPEFCAAHGVWLDANDLARLGDAGASIAHNPCSNLRLGSGIADVRAMLDAGVNVGIGTDASNTSDGQNMFEATRLATLLSRTLRRDPSAWVDAGEAFRLATVGSAKVLGFRDIGRITPGSRADIVFLDLASPSYVPLRAAVTQVILAESGSAVTDVMIGGRMVLEHGRITTLDEAALRGQANEAASRLDAATAGPRRFGAAVAPYVCKVCLDIQAREVELPVRPAGR